MDEDYRLQQELAKQMEHIHSLLSQYNLEMQKAIDNRTLAKITVGEVSNAYNTIAQNHYWQTQKLSGLLMQQFVFRGNTLEDYVMKHIPIERRLDTAPQS